jgi:hypothetical protein
MYTVVCRHCGKKVQSNKRLRHLLQHYCGEKACQSARKNKHERDKYNTNELYRLNKLQSARDRTDYVLENRKKQRVRNARKAGKTIQETKIVNPDAHMSQQPENDIVYAMIAVDYKKIVNPDAFMSKIIDMKSVTKAKPMFVRLL